MKQVLVFVTSVASPAEILQVKPALDHLVEAEGRWNFDLHDHEHILRVETATCQPAQVIEALRNKAHFCAELDH